ncbi:MULTISPECIES: allose kinase [Oscillospiraceae]|uniref:Allose kinase n=1 Tax=Harryflintia acetispora TaxID=1849041 RepID=A0A9X8Y7I0_9FIRM|nr:MULTISPECIES: allose kinase [Oscillospiraceae]RGB70035.1 allose kinase [Harryflintia acetispora]TCL42314.1 allose kinase [Harryflintia acetispora]
MRTQESGFDMRESYVIGIDIGGTNFRIGAVDDGGKLLHHHTDRSFKISHRENSVDLLVQYISDYLIQEHFQFPRAVSIGFPSAISRDRQTLYSTPNLEGFDGLPIVSILRKRLGVPVFIDKDVNHLLLYEIVARGIGREKSVVGIFVGSGIGNSIRLGGSFWRGKHGAAGELGHFQLPGRKALCNCGNVGCVERYAAGRRLEEIARVNFPQTEIDELFLRYGEQPILEEFVRDLSIPVVAEINIFDPDYVILGGGVLSMKGFPLEQFLEDIRSHTRKPYPGEDVEILLSDADPRNGILGAAYSALEGLKTGVCIKEERRMSI